MKKILIIYGLFLVGCEYINKKEIIKENPIARVHNSYLYYSDIQGLIPSDLNTTDSLVFVERVINDWVKKQLMIEKATKEININEAEIQSKVLDYRYALIRSTFEKQYILKNLDLAVPEEEIESYYDEHQKDFLLKQNIVRCFFVQIPNNAPRKKQFVKRIKKYPNDDLDKIKEYCTQYAYKTFMDDWVWTDFTEVISETPFQGILDENKILRKTDFLEDTDSAYTYYLKILEFKMIDDISPLNFVREDIKSILINQKKIALKKELENNIYNEAIENEAIEIFYN